MAQLIVRNIDETVKARLHRRAKLHGHSMEEEVRQILRDATKEPETDATGLGTRIAARFAGIGLKEDELQLPPRQPPRLMKFK
jgi:plasmid stability protein